MMDTNVALALIALATVFVTGTVTPIAVGYFQYRIRKAERVKDMQRQDDVAQAISDRDIKVDGKLEALQDIAQVTHGLVNSRMSVILQSMHDALVGQMESLKDNIELRRKNGNPPTEDAIAAVDTLRARISELRNLIAQRAATEAEALPK